MRLFHFVSVSSVVLAGWLAVTFVYHVPAQRYQKNDKAPLSAVTPPAIPVHGAVSDAPSPGKLLSVSR